MTDPKRWLEDPELPVDLGAWLEELPRPQQLHLDKLEALQSQLHSPTTPEWHAGDATTKTPVQPGPSAGLGAQLAGSAAGKLSVTLGLAALGGLGGWGLLGTSDDGSASHEITVKAPLPVPVAAGETPEEPTQPGADTESDVSPQPAEHSVGEAPSARSSTPAPSTQRSTAQAIPRTAPRQGGIAAEAALLAEAQGALPTNPARTLELLRTYDARFPRGSLSLERDLLRIDALARAGQHELARQEARAHMAAHPNSPYERRLASLDRIEAGSPGSTPKSNAPKTNPPGAAPPMKENVGASNQ